MPSRTSKTTVLASLAFALSCSREPKPNDDPASPATHAASSSVPPLGTLNVEVPPGTQADELSRVVNVALGNPSERCVVVWGNYQPKPDVRRPIAFRAPGTAAILSPPAWVTCPAPGIVSRFGDDRIKLVGLAYFRGDHFEYKASTSDEARSSGSLIVTPQGGSAVDMLARLDGVLARCLFAYLWLR